jgi:hypothetical protein
MSAMLHRFSVCRISLLLLMLPCVR